MLIHLSFFIDKFRTDIVIMKNFKTWALVPPKGWNSWDVYGASVTEQEVKRNADYLSMHLKKYGYEYVTVDIQWYEPTADSAEYHDFAPLLMDKYARLIPDPKRFPSAKNGKGFKPLADYIHNLGLKFGIHIMRGIPRQAIYQDISIKNTTKTARDIAVNNICLWNSDMFGVNVDLPEGQAYYNSIVNLYSSWGVDLIKVDDIAYSKLLQDTYKKEICAIRNAISQVGRPIILSLSPGPAPIKNALFFQQNANMWRITDDFWDQWESLLNMFEFVNKWSKYSNIGNWPDCDMLPLGHVALRSVGVERLTRFTRAEQRTMLTLWALVQSPLIIGSELPDMDKETLNMLTRSFVLDMDNNGISKQQQYRSNELIVWVSQTKLHKYVAMFNISNQSIVISDGIKVKYGLSDKKADLWNNQKLSELNLLSHDVAVFEMN